MNIFHPYSPLPNPTRSVSMVVYTHASSGRALSPVGRAYGYSSPQYAGNVRCTLMRLLYHVIVQAHGPKSRERRWMKKLWGQKSAPHGDSYCVQLVGTFALCLFYTNSYHLKLLNLSSFQTNTPKKKEFFFQVSLGDHDMNNYNIYRSFWPKTPPETDPCVR